MPPQACSRSTYGVRVSSGPSDTPFLIRAPESRHLFGELDRLLADDPQAGPVHVSLLDLEAALLSRLDRFDVAPQTMARIRELVRLPKPEPISVVAERRGPRRPRSSRRARVKTTKKDKNGQALRWVVREEKYGLAIRGLLRSVLTLPPT